MREERQGQDKFKSATEGMQQECYDRLSNPKLGENGDIIADYLIAYKTETGLLIVSI
jgi:hypothetical protein